MSLNGFHKDETIRILAGRPYGRSHGGRVLFNMLLACLSLLYDHSLMLTASFGVSAVSLILSVSTYPSHGLPSVNSGSQNTRLYLDVFQKYSQVCGGSSRRKCSTPFEDNASWSNES